MRGVRNLGEVGMVAVSWGFAGRTINAQMLGLVCLAPEACFSGEGPLHPAGDLVTSCLPLPDRCGNCMHLSRLPRPLGNVMRLLKWGPGPEGERGAPAPGRAGCGRSFPETQSGSPTETG